MSYGQEDFEKLNVPYSDGLTLYRPKGCGACDNTGYKGRMGIHELLLGTDEMKRLVQKHATIEEMRALAMDQGMTTLLQGRHPESHPGSDRFQAGQESLHQVACQGLEMIKRL